MSDIPPTATHHGTALAVGSRALLIRGPSGVGKSDLALRLLALPTSTLAAFGTGLDPVALIADDRVILTRQGAGIVVTAPASLRGLLEVRGIGIVPVQRISPGAALALVVDALTPDVEPPRLPEAGDRVALEGLRVPVVRLDPRAPSAPVKVLLALTLGVGIAPSA